MLPATTSVIVVFSASRAAFFSSAVTSALKSLNLAVISFATFILALSV